MRQAYDEVVTSAVAPRTAVAGASRGRVAATFGALAAAAGAGVLAFNDGRITTGRPGWLDALVLSALVLVAAAGWVIAERRVAAAQGLALYTGTLAAAQFASLTTLPDRNQLLLFALCPIGVVAAGLVALGWQTPQSRALLLPAALVTAALVVLALGFNPLHEPTCPLTCPDVPAVANSLMSSRSALTTAAGLSVAGALIVISVLLRPPRPAPSLVVLCAGWAAATSAVPLCARALGWGTSYDAHATLALPSAGGILLAGSVLLRAFADARARVRATRITELIAGLAEDRATSSGVQFAVPGEGRWIDIEGVPVEPDTEYVVLSHRGEPIARVVAHRRQDFAEEQIGPARRLALRNAQLTALARLRVEELRTARHRIVGTADAESRRIERDLHDGAQQRLVSSLLFLAVARRADPHLPELVAAEQAVTGALEQLRSLAHGIYPEVLRSEGVWAALDDLAAQGMPVPVRLDLTDTVRPPEHIGHALFAATVSILDVATAAPPADRVDLRAASDAEQINVHIALVGKVARLEDLVDASDRVGALGGRLALTQSAMDSYVSLELPCAS